MKHIGRFELLIGDGGTMHGFVACRDRKTAQRYAHHVHRGSAVFVKHIHDRVEITLGEDWKHAMTQHDATLLARLLIAANKFAATLVETK